MIRRFFHQFFWNTYDYLGSYFLLGSISGLGLLFIVTFGAVVGSRFSPGGPQVLFLVALALVLLLIKALLFSGFFAFAARAAKDEPARLPHFFEGCKRLFFRYLKLMLVLALVMGIAAANVVFYIRFASTVHSPVHRTVLFGLAMAFAWFGICAMAWMHCALAMPAMLADEETRTRPMMKQALMLFMLSPAFWFVVTVVSVLVNAVLIISVMGFLFLIPTFAALSTTATQIAMMALRFLRDARAELGDGRAIGEYRRKAAALYDEWEARQPRRTFRELIKPWQ